jgi:hypothetical protein
MALARLNAVLAGAAMIASTVAAVALDSTGRLGPASPALAQPAQANGVTRACAMRDVEMITLIEQHGAAQDVPGDKLAEAFFVVMAARNTCAAGREREALALYDSIKLAPTGMQATR